MLAAIGLQTFRPDSRRRSEVPYVLWTEALSAPVARLATVAPWEGMAHIPCVFAIGKRGQSYKFFEFTQLIPKEMVNER